MKDTQSISRRSFLKTLSVAVASVPLAGIAIRTVHAEDLKPLDSSNPTAAALGYVEDTGSVDAGKYPQHNAEQDCANCMFYTAGENGRGTCQLFPGFTVNQKGWCASWSKKS